MSDISNTSYDKSVVLVVYENASSGTAQIIRINEGAYPLSYDVIVKSADIRGWNVDNEPPIPDNKGGFYSGDRTHNIVSVDIKNAQTTADLVITCGIFWYLRLQPLI